MHKSTSAAFVISAATLACVVAGDRAEIGDCTPGTTYYVKVVGRDEAGNRGTASVETSLAAGYVTAASIVPAGFTDSAFWPMNGGFETQTDPAAPPDGWVIYDHGTGPYGVWGTDWVLDTSQVVSGAHSLKSPSTSGGANVAMMSQFFSVQEGARLRVRATWRHHGGSSLSQSDYIEVAFWDSAGTYLSIGTGVTAAQSLDAWTTGVSAPVTVPAGARYGRVTVWKGAETMAGTTPHYDFWVDDVAVETVLAVPAATYKSAPENFGTTSGVAHLLNYATKDYDALSDVTTGAAWKFTVRAGWDGKYLIQGAVDWAAGTAGPADLMLYKGGVLSRYLNRAQLPAGLCTMGGAAILDLVAGDYVDLRVNQTTGNPRTVSTSATASFVSI